LGRSSIKSLVVMAFPLATCPPNPGKPKLSTKWQEEILERELITMLAPIHVESSGRLLGAKWTHLRTFYGRKLLISLAAQLV